MQTFVKFAVTLAVLIVAVWGVLTLAETEKEIRILCGMFDPGEDLDGVVTTLETGSYLRYRTTGTTAGQTVFVDSPYNLRNSTCTVTASAERVVASTYRQRVPVGRTAAWIAAFGCVGLAVFQAVLAAGAPLGHLAWGGAHRRLPRRLRIASLAAAGLFSVGALCVLERAGVTRLTGLPEVADTVVWGLAVVLLLSTLANAVSPRPVEQRVMAPLALLLCCACILVGLGS